MTTFNVFYGCYIAFFCFCMTKNRKWDFRKVFRRTLCIRGAYFTICKIFISTGTKGGEGLIASANCFQILSIFSRKNLIFSQGISSFYSSWKISLLTLPKLSSQKRIFMTRPFEFTINFGRERDTKKKVLMFVLDHVRFRPY